MFATKTRYVVLIGLVAVALAGCSQPVAEEPMPVPVTDADALAVTPDADMLSVPSEDASVLLEASGGLPLWKWQKKLNARCVVKFYRPDDSFYLTEQDITVYPWSKAVRISASEPRSKFVWQLVDGQYALLVGDPSLDVSPLSGQFQGYSSAILQIVTAPVRFMDRGVEFHRVPTPERVRGKWYQRFTAKPSAKKVSGPNGAVVVEPHWTEIIYFMNRADALVDMIWLGNETRNEYLVVRGYDYSDMDSEQEGVLRVPAKMEIFRSDAEVTIYERIAEISLKGESQM